jgi:sister chromatid cohesion protein DCC1
LLNNYISSAGILRPLAPSYLHTILELLLTCLVSLGQTNESASVIELASSLESDHEIQRDVVTQVMSWFGAIEVDNSGEERWKMDVRSVVRQIGLGVLRHYKVIYLHFSGRQRLNLE